jgi:hypothetical protein
VDILRSDAMHAYLSDGVAAGERIAVTSIENPINGMRVRTGDEEQVSADEESADETKDDAAEETVAQGDE